MKWRNSKERELLSHGGSREQTLPTKNNPNPDLTDVGSLLTAEKLRNSNLTVQQLKQLKQNAAALMNDANNVGEMETDADEIDIEGYSDAERLVRIQHCEHNTYRLECLEKLRGPDCCRESCIEL